MSQTPKPPTDPTTANPNPSPNPNPDIGNEGQPDNVPPFGKQVTMADGFVITGQPDVTRADVQVRDISDVIDQFAGDLKIYCTQPDTLHMAPGLERRFHGLILPRAGIDINHPPLRRPVNAETLEVAARAVITTARTVPGGGSMRINADAMERDVAQAGFRRALLTEMEWPAEIVRYNLADTEQRVFTGVKTGVGNVSGLLPGDTLLRTGLAPATIWLQQNAERAKATLHDRARVRAEEQDALQGADGLPPGAMPEGPPPPATPPPPTTVVVPVHSPGTPAAPAPAAHHHTGHTGSTGQAGSPGGTTGTPHRHRLPKPPPQK